ncbi:glucosidase 2 subunit beta [Carex littledalei]|uniref:Glucosidase 2 subunit beta n=1 Tax=Carex littledalei TaxID=544730 RepID=A0A833QU13_9POAL|nr:glucosidase 2 subunit beta [Carex littledalei]
MSVVYDRPILDPYNNGVRQGKRKEVEREERNNRSGFYIEDEEEIGSDRSSIGVDSNCSSSLTSSFGEEEEEEEEVNSNESVKGGLGSFDSLEESLPIKKGLSNFFSGKSKSFATLSSASVMNSSATDLAKPENPFNKRRRILLTCNRRASYSSFVASLPPLLSPHHQEEEKDDDSDEEKEAQPALNGFNRSSLISPRSLSLCDLRHV